MDGVPRHHCDIKILDILRKFCPERMADRPLLHEASIHFKDAFKMNLMLKYLPEPSNLYKTVKEYYEIGNSATGRNPG